nr:MAG TPA: hypothetical protein [Caudoviricetes sp.]
MISNSHRQSSSIPNGIGLLCRWLFLLLKHEKF